MRVLVTRPRAQAELTAARLLEAGHVPLISSVTEVEALPAIWPGGRYEGVVATSPNALRFLPPEHLAGLIVRPIHVVGPATADAARALGFTQVFVASGSATALADDLIAQVAPDHRLLYLAGDPRKPVLEDRLGAAGRPLQTVVLYRAVSAPGFAPEAVRALSMGEIDAVLHHSREAAGRFAALASAAGLQDAVRNIGHLCLSQDVGMGLAGLNPLRVFAASEPTDAALLALLDERR